MECKSNGMQMFQLKKVFFHEMFLFLNKHVNLIRTKYGKKYPALLKKKSFLSHY